MLGLFKKSNKPKKVVIIGIDGVPYSLLTDYMQRGLMPELSRLCESGRLLRMRSSLPEISSVAWTSFMTGKNPGEHGIFGFMELNRQTYEYTFPNFQSLKVRPLWERERIKTIAFNIPQTYPAVPMDGVMVSGFVALDLAKATYPSRVYEHLRQADYRIDVNTKLAAENPESFFVDLFTTFEKRRQAIEHLYTSEDWQLFIGVVTETDRLHHFFFDSAGGGRYFEVFTRFYGELDRFLSAMAKRAADDGALFLTCSDHGFAPITSEVYLNTWLTENGYLHRNGGMGLAGITRETKAFCLDPSRIYLNREGEYGRGSVRAEEAEGLLRELRSGLEGLTFEGNPVVRQAFWREEIFSGEQKASGPDLYLLPNPGFDLKGAPSKPSVFGTTHFRGMHTYDDAHLFVSQPQLAPPEPGIEDIAGIVLKGLA